MSLEACGAATRGCRGNAWGGAATQMTVSMTVKDGENVVAANAAKFAAMFEMTGDLGDWTGAAKQVPTVTTTGTDAIGKMTFVVTPGDGSATKAFNPHHHLARKGYSIEVRGYDNIEA